MVAEPKPHQTGRKRQNVTKTGNDWWVDVLFLKDQTELKNFFLIKESKTEGDEREWRISKNCDLETSLSHIDYIIYIYIRLGIRPKPRDRISDEEVGPRESRINLVPSRSRKS